MQKIKAYLLGAILISMAPAMAEIHKWVDEHGKIHYGDRPPQSSNVQTLEVSVESFSSVEIRQLNPDDIAVLSSEVKGNVKNKRVVMYSTETCGYCKKAKAYFSERGIDYSERDINKDASARKQWEKLNGTGVPLILIGKRKMSGFSVDRFEKIYFSNS